MHDLQIVKCFEPTHYLNENSPYDLFVKYRFFLLVFGNVLKQISIVCELDDEAKGEGRAYHNDSESGSINDSLYETTNFVLTEARIQTSLSAFSFSFSVSPPIFTFFNA